MNRTSAIAPFQTNDGRSDQRRWVSAYGDHRRAWKDFLYVYPTVSRRSRGVSLGVNLNPNQVCNFDCVYCGVDRRQPARTATVDFGILEQELRELLMEHQSGNLFREEPFASVPPDLRRLNDIAFAGDGEPTMFGLFAEAVERVAAIKRELTDAAVKLVLITNGSGLGRADVKRGLSILDANQGEVWVKLDAGTAKHMQAVNRTRVRMERILVNIEGVGQTRAICIQSLFFRMRGAEPAASELTAYCGRLRRLASRGCRIREVQIYTVAREPAEVWVDALSRSELAAIGLFVQAQTGLHVECYAGAK